MSWSMSCKGTADACKRTLADAKIYGTPPVEEQAVFDSVRVMLLDLVAKGQTAQGDACIAVYDIGASGHGTQVSNARFMTELIFVK